MERKISRGAGALLHEEMGTSTESHIAWYHKMQATQPVYYHPEYELWEVFSYKDVQHVLLDHAHFTSIETDFPSTLGKSEPPRHRLLRSLVAKAFTPRCIEELAPRIIEIVESLLEPAVTDGKMDFITGLTYPLPARVIAEMLGLPMEDQARFREWSNQLLVQLMYDEKSDNSEAFQYFSDLLEERKHHPRNDLISTLLATEEDGAYLAREEILNMCLELMMAGNVTTIMLLSYALRRLCQRPEIYEALHTDPSLVPGVIEETLRYDFSAFNLRRTARQDTLLGGQQIKVGDQIVVWTGAANFDKTYFPQADLFDIKRSPNPHLTFGYGIHVCLGAPLARLEARIALEQIIARFSAICLDPEDPLNMEEQIPHLGVLFTLAEAAGIQ